MSAENSHDARYQLAVKSGADALRVARNQLLVHQALGIHDYPVSPDIVRFLEMTAEEPGRAGIGGGEPCRDQAVVARGKKPEKVLSLDNLRLEMISCARCPLAGNALGTVTGSGSASCRLMVVGDWSWQRKNDFDRQILFGPDEDTMLWKMIAAIKLDRDDVYVTNCIKCCPENENLPDRTSEKSCFSFLGREIAAANPLVICAMGETAARVLTGSQEPLARLRGKFTSYRYESEGNISIISTYHPRFLLKNPEMKKAVWNDLQSIQRRLAAG